MDIKERAGLDPDSAKRLMYAYATDAKRLAKEIESARAELELWRNRTKLAQSKGIDSLVTGAEKMVAEIEGKIASMESERVSMMKEAEQLRQEMPVIEGRVRSIDPDLLLADLQMTTGEAMEPEKVAAEAAMRKLETGTIVEDALTALKRKMGLVPAAAEKPENPGSTAANPGS